MNYRNREWLHDQYVINKKTNSEIASQFNITTAAIEKWLRKFNIFAADRVLEYQNKDWLYKECVTNYKTDQQVSMEQGVAEKTIRIWRLKHGIRRKRAKFYDEPIKITCSLCGNDFFKNKNYINSRKGKGAIDFYCSRLCADKKHSKVMAGAANPNFEGEYHGPKMIDLTKEERKLRGAKSAETRKKNGSFLGTSNPRWAGGRQKVNCSICNREYDVAPYVYRKVLAGERLTLCNNDCRRIYALTVLKIAHTSIEIKMAKELDSRKIKYVDQYNLGNKFSLDFFLPEYGIVIECDGDYWHNIPSVSKRDISKNNYIKACGFKLFRFWEHEINENVGNCVDIVLKKINSNTIAFGTLGGD